MVTVADPNDHTDDRMRSMLQTTGCWFLGSLAVKYEDRWPYDALIPLWSLTHKKSTYEVLPFH